MLLAPLTLQVCVVFVSTSDTESVPTTEVVPETSAPASVWPASVTVPSLAAALLVTTAMSLEPLIVTVTVWSAIAPKSSVTRTVKVSTTD